MTYYNHYHHHHHHDFFDGDGADYQTNAPSYYDALARFNESLKQLTERMNDVEQRFEDLMKKWLEDGTLAGILEDVLLDKYATEDFVQRLIDDLNIEEYAKLDYVNNELQDIHNIIDDVQNQLSRQDNVTVSVGKGGDFQTINDAIDYIHTKPIRPLTADILMLNNFEFTEQVLIENKDLRYMAIKPDNPGRKFIVDENILTQQKTVDYKEGQNKYPLFYGKNSIMPTISGTFELGSKNVNTSVGILLDNSNLRLEPETSFNGFYNAGMFIVNSNVTASFCHFDNNGNRSELNENNVGDAEGHGILSWNSQLTANNSTANNTGDVGFNINNGSNAFISYSAANNVGHHALMASGSSTVSAHSCEFLNCIDDALTSYAGSHIDARGSDVSGTKVNFGAIATRNSTLLIQNGKLNNCSVGTMANRGSTVDVTNAEIHNSGEDAIRCANSSQVTATGVDIESPGRDGIHVTHEGDVNARESTIKNPSRHGVRVFLASFSGNEMSISGAGEDGGHISRTGMLNLSHSSISDSGNYGIMAFSGEANISKGNISNSGARAIFCSQGSFVTAYNTNITGTQGDYDLAVFNGGIISAIGSSGSINFDDAINKVSSNGIVITDPKNEPGN